MAHLLVPTKNLVKLRASDGRNTRREQLRCIRERCQARAYSRAAAQRKPLLLLRYKMGSHPRCLPTHLHLHLPGQVASSGLWPVSSSCVSLLSNPSWLPPAPSTTSSSRFWLLLSSSVPFCLKTNARQGTVSYTPTPTVCESCALSYILRV